MMKRIGKTTRALMAVSGILTVAYLAAPYIALFQLGQAIRQGDASLLANLIDWDEVREGIKEDICDAASDAPEIAAGTVLPAFGASFVRGIASNAIDDMVTAEHLAASARPATNALAMDDLGALSIEHAFFDGPTSFEIVVRQDTGAAPIRLRMDLRHGGWRVTRAWLPPELLEGSAART